VLYHRNPELMEEPAEASRFPRAAPKVGAPGREFCLRAEPITRNPTLENANGSGELCIMSRADALANQPSWARRFP
jgi:hypothetical protein